MEEDFLYDPDTVFPATAISGGCLKVLASLSETEPRLRSYLSGYSSYPRYTGVFGNLKNWGWIKEVQFEQRGNKRVGYIRTPLGSEVLRYLRPIIATFPVRRDEA